MPVTASDKFRYVAFGEFPPLSPKSRR